MPKKSFEFHLISDGKHSVDALVQKTVLTARYVDYIHIREKEKSAAELYETIRFLKKSGVSRSKMIVNDRVDVAFATEIAGVQLAYHSLKVQTVKRSFPNLRIGKSVHSVGEAQMAEKNGADYLLFGHVFPSTSKPNLPSQGLKNLHDIVKQTKIPVIAIGGIHPHHVTDILTAGASGIAVMSGVFGASDPIEAIKAYTERSNVYGY